MPDDQRIKDAIERGHEAPDERRSALLWLAAIAIGVVVLGDLVTRATLRVLTPEGRGEASAVYHDEVPTPPPPTLRPNPRLDRIAHERRDQARLTGYAWANEAEGTARVPIERAMQMALERGFRSREGGAATLPPGADREDGIVDASGWWKRWKVPAERSGARGAGGGGAGGEAPGEAGNAGDAEPEGEAGSGGTGGGGAAPRAPSAPSGGSDGANDEPR